MTDDYRKLGRDLTVALVCFELFCLFVVVAIIVSAATR